MTKSVSELVGGSELKTGRVNNCMKPEGPGEPVMPDYQLEEQRSTMFDAVFIPGGAGIKLVAKDG